MTVLNFHHVGIGTTDFDTAIETYVSLGHRLHHSVDDPGLNVRVAFLSCPGGVGPWIEILAPLNDGGPLEALIRRRTLPSPYHTCYSVDQLEAATAELCSLAFLPVGEPHAALAFDNARVAFFYHGSVGLIELVEKPSPWPIPLP